MTIASMIHQIYLVRSFGFMILFCFYVEKMGYYGYSSNCTGVAMNLKPQSKVAALREQAGLTQVQVAALVGVTPNTIQNWEKPDGLSQLERYLKLAETFGCQVNELIEYIPLQEDEKPKSKGFSLKELREIRERWGTSTTTETSKPEPVKNTSSRGSSDSSSKSQEVR